MANNIFDPQNINIIQLLNELFEIVCILSTIVYINGIYIYR